MCSFDRYYTLLDTLCTIIKLLFVKPGARQPKAGACLVSWNCFCPRIRYVCMSVCVRPEDINYIHVILNQYNQLNKFVAFRNVTKLSMHRRGHCNEARRDKNQPNKAILVPKNR